MAKNQTNSIRVRSASEYVIEVNDKGESITLDASDNNLILKMIEAFETIDKLYDEYEKKAAELGERPDEPLSVIKNDDGEPAFTLTKNLKAGYALLDRLYAEARAAMDLFLGDGACQKIFGDKNYPDMFSDLGEQLKPHLEKMGVSVKQLREKTLQKHGLNRQQRRALK